MENMKKHQFCCSLCDAVDFTAIGFSGFYSSRTTARICRKCGLVCLNPRWDEAGYAEYYRKAYYNSYLSLDSMDSLPGERGLTITKVTAQCVDTSASILEIGSGFGGNLIALSQQGFGNLAGVEVDDRCCRIIHEKLPSCNIFNGTLGEYAFTKHEKHDLVILSHVLEHFVEPKVALKQISTLLKLDGKLMILVPDTGAPRHLMQQLTTPHTHYFTHRTLNLLLHTCGFENLKRYDDLPGDIFILCQRTASKLAPPPLRTSEYSERLRSVGVEWLTAWPNQLGRRLCELILSEQQARTLWQRIRNTQ